MFPPKLHSLGTKGHDCLLSLLFLGPKFGGDLLFLSLESFEDAADLENR
jgi:hypothetical protein